MRLDRCHRFIRYAGALLCVIVVAACSTVTAPSADRLEAVLSGVDLLPKGQALALPEDRFMHLSDEMRSFLQTYVQKNANRETKLRQLVSAILHPGSLNLEYYPHRTYSAADTFFYQRGNCLSFSAMLVAMAREVGLKAYFNEVDIPPTWDRHRDNTLILYKHINVMVQIHASQQVVDLNLENYNPDYRQGKISDREAEAQYYNNRSIEYLHEDNSVDAFRYARKAIELGPELTYTWSNLGSIYRRQGLYRQAETAYIYALHLNPGNRVAMSNLSRVYTQLGDSEQALHYKNMVTRFRMNNPYYRYYLAEQALQQRQLQVARRHIAAAIRDDDDNHSFHFLAARIYAASGQHPLAEQSLQRAATLTRDDSTRQRYQQKLQKLSAVVAGNY